MCINSYSKKDVGKQIADRFYHMVDTGMRIRDERSIPVIDLNYLNVRRDPQGSVHTIGERCRIKIENESGVNKQMNKLKNRQPYTPEEFGIDKERIYNRFGDYMERFNIEKEDC